MGKCAAGKVWSPTSHGGGSKQPDRSVGVQSDAGGTPRDTKQKSKKLPKQKSKKQKPKKKKKQKTSVRKKPTAASQGEGGGDLRTDKKSSEQMITGKQHHWEVSWAGV